jgi:L-threonylcarbamoyladenylate synthase
LKTELLPNESLSFIRAAKLLSGEEVVALPTETVYGLAGNAFSDVAVQKIFLAKERPSFDPLIVHISERYLKDPRAVIPALVQDGILAPEILASADLPKIHAVMKKYWPGPLTLILPRGAKISDSVTASQNTVGIRCPAHPVFQAVLSKIAFPLAAPSANRFGRISPTESEHVMTELDGRIPAVIEGGSCEVGVESTILKIDFPFRVTLLRPGKFSKEELETSFQTTIALGATLGELAHAKTNEVTPGSLDEHYAPRKALYLFPHSFSEEATQNFLKENGLSSALGVLSMSGVPAIFTHDSSNKIRVLSPSNDLNEIARGLFKNLRELDEDESVQTIVADLPFDHASGIGAAIADRLRRASRNKPKI